MKRKLLDLLEYDHLLCDKKYDYYVSSEYMVVFSIENTRKYYKIEREFTFEEFEIVKAIFGLD